MEAVERAIVVAALGAHYDAGRIDAATYGSRAMAAAAAGDRARLVAAFAGLPLDGPGILPADLRDGLIGEGLRVLVEDLPGAMVFRRYRAPGQRIFRRTVPVRGALVLSRRRFVVWAGGAKRVDLAFADSRWDAALDISVDRAGRLRVVASVAPFHPDRSGRIEYRLTTRRAREISAVLTGSR